ncbi:MAG TPA: glycosyltransferase family 87 protein [Acetobacteraceae bacterium]|nr:glycosyltransferase family 87 protein [Acetobacteraceae bacterium]
MAVLVALAAVVGAFGWLIFFFLFRDTLGQDWMVFDTAVQAWRHGDVGLLLDGPRFTAVLNATHAGWLKTPLVFHPWVYPPYTLLLALPFALLPWSLSYIGFQALSLGFLLVALWQWCPPGRRGALLLGGVVFCPATAFTLGAGQNSFFSAGLVVGGMWLLPRRPIMAGLLLGLLAFKPQLAILVPVALLSLRAWRVLAAAACTVVLLLLASLVVPGPGLWRGWLHLFLSGDPAFHTWVNEGRLHGQSVFAYLHFLGLPDGWANIGQVAAAAFAACCVWIAFRAPRPAAERLAVLLCAMVLAAAHLGDYDCILLGIGAMLLLVPEAGVAPMPVAVLATLAWCSTGINPPSVLKQTIPVLFYLSELTPVIVAVLLGFLIARAPQRRVAPVMVS